MNQLYNEKEQRKTNKSVNNHFISKDSARSYSLSWWCIAFLNMEGQRKYTPFGAPKTPTYNSSVQVYDMDGSSSLATRKEDSFGMKFVVLTL